MKVLVVVPEVSNRMELLLSLKRLAEANIEYTLTSPKEYFKIEKVNDVFQTDVTLDNLQDEDFEALILVSGHPRFIKSMFNHPKVDELVQSYNEQGKVVSAICSSVICLQNVCKGKRLAAFPLDEIVSVLTSKGAILTGKTLEVDGNLVTAANEMATDIRIEKIIELISK